MLGALKVPWDKQKGTQKQHNGNTQDKMLVLFASIQENGCDCQTNWYASIEDLSQNPKSKP